MERRVINVNDHMKYESKEIEKTLKELNYTTVLNSYTNESVPDILLFRWMREGRIVGKYISNGDLLATQILF